MLLAVTIESSLKLLGNIPRELNNRGVEVHVAYSPKNWKNCRTPDTEGVTFHKIWMTRGINPLVDIISLASWLWIVGRVRPGIVAGGTPKAAALSLIVARLLNVPRRIYVLRGLRLESESGLLRKLLATAEKLTSMSSSEILSVSESLRDLYIGAGLNSGRKVSVLGFGSSKGVDTEFFRPNEAQKTKRSLLLQSKTQPLVVGFAGRITSAKGPIDVLEAQIILRNLGHDIESLFVGPLDDGRYSDRFLKKVNRTDGSSYLGEISDLRAFYSTIDVLCLPTMREGFPNVVLEAASMGVPSITTNATGAIDSVIHGVTGIVIPRGSKNALVQALLTFIAEPSLVASMGSRARQRASGKFNIDLVTSNTCDFLLGQGVQK